MAYKIMLDAGHGRNKMRKKSRVHIGHMRLHIFSADRKEKENRCMKEKIQGSYYIGRVFLGEISIEEILLHILYRSFLVKDPGHE